MARPAASEPTPVELEILQVLWDRGPSTVREVMEVLNRRQARAYTTVMTLLVVMERKKLVARGRDRRGKALVYQAARARQRTLGGMVDRLLRRAFGGSSSVLVAHLLERARPSAEEMAEIRRTIEAYERGRGGGEGGEG